MIVGVHLEECNVLDINGNPIDEGNKSNEQSLRSLSTEYIALIIVEVIIDFLNLLKLPEWVHRDKSICLKNIQFP